MSSLDFALKDFYRNRNQSYPFLLIIIIVVSISEFLIYFNLSLGLNAFTESSFDNDYYFSSGVFQTYKQFSTLIQILLIILTVIIIIVVTTTLIVNKKKDIGIMRSLGTLPRKLYSFYLSEAYIIFFLGFLIGLILGWIIFGIFGFIISFFDFDINYQIDFFYTPIMFLSCLLGIFIVTGFVLRKIGKEEIISTFSKDIPYNYDASKRLTSIPKWLSSLGYNLKISIINTKRRKGEFKRYLIVFSLISLIIFTLGLGLLVLRSSSQNWINKSQGKDIVAIGHKDVINNYSLMYNMFSNPKLIIDKNMINFTNSAYFFNLSDINEIRDIEGIRAIDERIINFFDVEELQGFHYNDYFERYELIGKNRRETIPIIGINPETIIQNFEIEGRFFTEEDSFDNMTVGDGLGLNFFEYALDQSLRLTSYSRTFHISGVVIDSFYSGYAGYISLNETRDILNLKNEEINLLLIRLNPSKYNDIKDEIDNILTKLGSNFTQLKLDTVFKKNLYFISNLSLYPLFLIVLICLIAILSLYNYQKSGIMEKARDFLIMKAIGSKSKSLRRILFIEAIFIIIPSLLLSLGIGMILNSIVIFGRVDLPPLYIPFILIAILFSIFIVFNNLSLIPIMRKINKFSIKDFNIY